MLNTKKFGGAIRLGSLSANPSDPSDPETPSSSISTTYSSSIREVRAEQVKKQNQFLLDNSWDAVTIKHLELFAAGEQEKNG